VAVVAAVVIGIGTAMLFNDGDGEGNGNPQAGNTPTAGPGGGEEQKAGQNGDGGKQDEKADLPKEDAAALQFGGGARAESTIPGAKGSNGAYVNGMNAVGSSVTWQPELKKAGAYDLYVSYSVPGQKMNMSLDVNGKPHGGGLNMDNFAHAPKGDWEKGWTYTFATVHLKKGQNTFVLSCKQGDKCNALIDQVWLAPPEEKS
jgi:hypothetical protein